MMHSSSLLSKRRRMRGTAMSMASERSFAEHHHYQDFIFKASATDLHSERHRRSQGKQWPSGMY